MTLNLRWLGFDYGQCMMDPVGLRNPVMFGEIMRELGRPEEIAETMHRYRRMKETYGTYGFIKEGHKPEILEYVFDGDEEAMALFDKYEIGLLLPGKGFVETLPWLREQGIRMDIVAEGKKTLGPITSVAILPFLQNNGLTQYFGYLYMPMGKINLADSSVDLSCQGKDKTSGTLYEYIIEDLAKQGIKVDECAMIGDKLTTDIEQPRKRGFHTIQFTGCVDMGSSEYAEYRVNSFLELKDFVRGIK